MRVKILLLLLMILLCSVVVSCDSSVESLDDSVEYPFEAIYGSWKRTGTIGAMGVTYLTADENIMEWRVLSSELLFTYTVRKIQKNVYEVTWYSYDEDTGQSSSDVAMVVTISFEEEDLIYMITNAAGMGGLTMERLL